MHRYRTHVNCKIKCDTPEGASNGKAREKHIHSISWMQRHVAAGGVWGVGAQPLPIIPSSAAEWIPKEMSEKLSPLVGGVRGGGKPPQPVLCHQGTKWVLSLAKSGTIPE